MFKMTIEDLVVVKVFDRIADEINDNIENSVLKGLVWIIFGLILIYLVLYISCPSLRHLGSRICISYTNILE